MGCLVQHWSFRSSPFLRVISFLVPLTVSVTEMADNEGIADLLSQKYFLSKILIHLVDSGLHECRRVCRLWREVCNQLPVKLSLVFNEKIAAVSDTFPNGTVSLEVGEASPYEDAGFAEMQLESCMPFLLRNVRHLTLNRSTQWPRFLDKLEPGSESLSSLLSLSVKQTSQLNHSATLDLLKFLTALTALTLEGEPIPDVQNSDPITEIRNLKSLTVSLPLLAKSDGQLFFAASTRLTRLDILPTYYNVYFDIPLLQVSSSHCLNNCVIFTSA